MRNLYAYKQPASQGQRWRVYIWDLDKLCFLLTLFRTFICIAHNICETVKDWERSKKNEYTYWCKCKECCNEIAYLRKNMILVCVYLTFQQWLNMFGRKFTLLSPQYKLNMFCVLSLTFGGKFNKLAEFKILEL